MNLNFQTLLLRLQISWERSKKGSFMNKFVWYQNFAIFKFSVTFEIWWFDAKWCQCGIVLNNDFDRNQKTCVKHFDEKSWVDERLMRNESKYVSIHAWWKLIGKHCRRKGGWWWDNECLIMVMMWMWNDDDGNDCQNEIIALDFYQKWQLITANAFFRSTF